MFLAPVMFMKYVPFIAILLAMQLSKKDCIDGLGPNKRRVAAQEEARELSGKRLIFFV